MSRKSTPCARCGTCCSLLIEIAASDVLRWHREGRNDILAHLVDDHLELEVDGWFHPTTRERLEVCPFLEQHTDGAIQHTKPLACSHYRPGRCAGLKLKSSARNRSPRANLSAVQ